MKAIKFLGRSSVLGLALAVMVVAGWTGTASARHEATCPVGTTAFHGTLGIDAEIFAIEGPLSATTIGPNTQTVMDVTMDVPLDVDTGVLSPNVITFAQLADPDTAYGLPSNFGLTEYKSILGGTIIADGLLEVTGTAPSLCVSTTVTANSYGFGEHVALGTLTGVDTSATDPRDHFFIINNQLKVKMNTDPRFGHELFDLAFRDSLTVADLAGSEGTFISSEGYWDDVNGFQRAIIVETEVAAVGASADEDTVALARFIYREAKGEVRLGGDVTLNGGVSNSTRVTAYLGRIARAGLSGRLECIIVPGVTPLGVDTAPIGEAILDPQDGVWGLRVQGVNLPSNNRVCVESDSFTTSSAADQSLFVRQ